MPLKNRPNRLDVLMSIKDFIDTGIFVLYDIQDVRKFTFVKQCDSFLALYSSLYYHEKYEKRTKYILSKHYKLFKETLYFLNINDYYVDQLAHNTLDELNKQNYIIPINNITKKLYY